MHNITVELDNTPGTLAAFGETLGNAGVSLEGGGVFACGRGAIANFLVRDGAAAQQALQRGGFTAQVREVLVLRLDQHATGQLGKLARRMADAGVNIDVQYSDHANRLILVVDDSVGGGAVAKAWMAALRT